MHDLTGGCHCGRIRYRYRSPTAPKEIQPRACRCDFCRRIGGNYASHPDASLAADLDGRERPYRFGTETAEFWVCPRCGNTPFVTCDIEGRRYAVVNVNTFDDFDLDAERMSLSDFEGETRENRLARRAKNWIGRVDLRFKKQAESSGDNR